MGFLVGNDFIPHLPHLHIHSDALPTLWKAYKVTLPKLDGRTVFRHSMHGVKIGLNEYFTIFVLCVLLGYLHDGGVLNLRRFEIYLKELSKVMHFFRSNLNDSSEV